MSEPKKETFQAALLTELCSQHPEWQMAQMFALTMPKIGLEAVMAI